MTDTIFILMYLYLSLSFPLNSLFQACFVRYVIDISSQHTVIRSVTIN